MLFRKSQVLWKIPSLTAVSPKDSKKPDVILASDTQRLPGPNYLGLGGRFSEDLYPVRVPSGWRTAEASILLEKRDCKKYGGYWLTYLNYFGQYIEDKNVFNEDDLDLEHKAVFEALKTGSANPYDLLYNL